MNAGLSDLDASIHYYDSDYPSADHGRFAENLDAATEGQGVAHDVARFLAHAAELGGPILEVGCGTGRVSIPLARAGHRVHAVDLSAGMLERLRSKLEGLPPELGARLTLEQADATGLDLAERGFALVLMPFNTLPCIPDFDAQRAVLVRIREHMLTGGRLLIDLISPFKLQPQGDPLPRPFFTRRNEHSGNPYTRFAMQGPMDADQRQELKGWYDEIEPDGRLLRRHYSLFWRPLQRFEIQLMLEAAGFELDSVEGGHRGEPFTAQSPHMLLRASAR